MQSNTIGDGPTIEGLGSINDKDETNANEFLYKLMDAVESKTPVEGPEAFRTIVNLK